MDIAPRGRFARFSADRGVPRMSHWSFEKSGIQISGGVFIRSEGCAHCSRPSLDRAVGQVFSSLSGRRQSGTRATEACRGDPHCLHRGCEPRAHRCRCIGEWRSCCSLMPLGLSLVGGCCAKSNWLAWHCTLAMYLATRRGRHCICQYPRQTLAAWENRAP